MPPRSHAAFAAAIAALVSTAAYLAYGNVGLGLQDEGFLWYGVQRTLHGEVPLRDFQSYDAGRYYWCALWSPLFGDGILGVRKALAVFAGLGLWCGLLCVARLVRGRASLVAWAIVLELWMFPPHKQFEHAAAMMLVQAATVLVERPKPRVGFGCGALVGLLGWLGRNHGLYGSCAFAVVYVVLLVKEPAARTLATVLAFPLGVLFGALPLLAMIAFVPGFGDAVVDSVLFNLRWGANLPHAVPWPWTVSFEGRPWWAVGADLALGIAFLALPVVYALGLLASARAPRGELRSRAVLLAASAVGVFYAHHASVRSDAAHLAQCIQPLLIATLALAALGGRRGALVATLGVAVVSVLAACTFNLRFSVIRPFGHRPRLEPVDVLGEPLRLTPRQSAEVRAARILWDEQVPAGAPLFAAPNLPGLYALGERRSPTWGLFFQAASPPEVERAMLEHFEETGLEWALLSDFAISGREDLRFEETHPQLVAWLRAHFAPVPAARFPEHWTLLRRR